MQAGEIPDREASASAVSDASGAELCVAHYQARQIAGCVVIYALGVHQSTGRLVFFQRDPGEHFPPQFSLWHIRSGAPEVHTVTPFSAATSFQTVKQVTSVLVTDAAGRHAVGVEMQTEVTQLHN